MRSKQTDGHYEASENILHLRYPNRVELCDVADVRVFFDEVLSDWVRPCPQKPYLLVSYRNVHLAPAMANTYAESIDKLRPLVLGTFRYDVPADFTGVTVALGNMRLMEPANIFPDEATARLAIARAKSGVKPH